MKGHDLLAMLRSKTLYQRMKEILDGTGLPLTSDTLDLIQHEASDELIREWASKKNSNLDHIDESALVRVTSCAMLHMKQDGIGVPNYSYGA